MFGRNPIIPIDLIYPNRLEFTQETIPENHTVQRSEIIPSSLENYNKMRTEIEMLKIKVCAGDIDLNEEKRKTSEIKKN